MDAEAEADRDIDLDGRVGGPPTGREPPSSDLETALLLRATGGTCFCPTLRNSWYPGGGTVDEPTERERGREANAEPPADDRRAAVDVEGKARGDCGPSLAEKVCALGEAAAGGRACSGIRRERCGGADVGSDARSGFCDASVHAPVMESFREAELGGSAISASAAFVSRSRDALRDDVDVRRAVGCDGQAALKGD